jgi:hypothetical protein
MLSRSVLFFCGCKKQNVAGHGLHRKPPDILQHPPGGFGLQFPAKNIKDTWWLPVKGHESTRLESCLPKLARVHVDAASSIALSALQLERIHSILCVLTRASVLGGSMSKSPNNWETI